MRTSFHFTRYACGPASPAQVSPVRVMEMAYLAADLGGSGPIVLPSGGFHFQDLRAPRNFALFCLEMPTRIPGDTLFVTHSFLVGGRQNRTSFSPSKQTTETEIDWIAAGCRVLLPFKRPGFDLLASAKKCPFTRFNLELLFPEAGAGSCLREVATKEG